MPRRIHLHQINLHPPPISDDSIERQINERNFWIMVKHYKMFLAHYIVGDCIAITPPNESECPGCKAIDDKMYEESMH